MMRNSQAYFDKGKIKNMLCFVLYHLFQNIIQFRTLLQNICRQTKMTVYSVFRFYLFILIGFFKDTRAPGAWGIFAYKHKMFQS